MRRRRRTAWAAGLAAMIGVLAGAARADFDPEAWRTWREIKVAEGAAGEHARFVLDADVWNGAAGPGLHDLRVLCDENDDIGYAVYAPEKPPVRVEKREARVFNAAKRGTEASELTLDLGENPGITNRITLRTPDTDFRCGVVVEGSDDGTTWKTLRDDGAIFAFRGDVEKRFTTVSFPDAKVRYLRVVAAAPPGGKPIDLDGAEVFEEVEGEKDRLPLLVERPQKSRTDTTVGGESWYTLDLGAKHLPVSKIEVVTADEDFSRPVRIDVGDDLKMPAQAGGGHIFRYRTTRYREERLSVEFPEAFGRYVRVRITNGDDPPPTLSRIVAYGRPRYVFFPFQTGRRYRLFYGNPGARPARYDYADVFERIGRSAAIEARLGDPQANPRFIATKTATPPHPWIVRNQWVLYAALGVAVVGLIVVAVRALRQPPPEEDAGG